jgi:hypothetical protein
MQKFIFFADTHCGNLLGLTPPEWMNAQTEITQRPLWEWWESKIMAIGPVDFAVLAGDAVDGEGKKENIGHITTNTKEQANIAAACYNVVQAKKKFLCYGTPYHTTGTYSYEEVVADLVGGEIQDTLLLDVEGIKFNIRHVASRSNTPYGQGTLLYREAVRDLINCLLEEREEADYIIRAHAHLYWRDENSRTTAILLPGLQIPDGIYGRSQKPFYYDIGFLYGEIKDRQVTLEPYIMPLKIVKKAEYICLNGQ